MPKRDTDQTEVKPMKGPERRQAERVATRPADATPFAPVDGDQAAEEEGDGE